MKIVVSSCDTRSLATFRLDMMIFFVKQGYQVYALGNDSSPEWRNYFKKYEIHYVPVNCDRNGTSISKDIVYYFDLKKKINNIKPSLIFTYQLKSNLYTGFIKPKGVKLVTLFSGLGTIYMSDKPKHQFLRKCLYFPMKISLKKSDYVLFHNKENKEKLVLQKLVTEHQSYVVHGSGVNVDDFPFTKMDYSHNSDQINFLYLGRILEDKGVLEFMEAAKRVKTKFPNTSFSIVGNFDSNPSSLSPKQLKLYDGYVDYLGETDNPYYYMKKSTVFVYPSYHEGLPKSVIEAMSVGRPIITTDVPGCRETVTQGKNGYLVPAKDVIALEQAMSKMVIKSHSYRQKMGELSRKMVEERFSVDIINKQIFNIIKGNGEEKC